MQFFILLDNAKLELTIQNITYLYKTYSISCYNYYKIDFLNYFFKGECF